MPRPTGSGLEAVVRQTFAQLGLDATRPTGQVALRTLDPAGAHSVGDHLELDFLVPVGSICIIGEVTDRGGTRDLEKKYSTFRRQFGIVNRLALNDAFWLALGVKRNALRPFRAVRELRAMFIASHVESFDVKITSDPTAGVSAWLRSDWNLLRSYADSLGTYARNHLLAHLGVSSNPANSTILVTKRDHSLVVSPDKRVVSRSSARTDVFTFELSPYKLLPAARVYRRDELPDLSATVTKDYQRPLLLRKLTRIREDLLLRTTDFLFPSSILVILSEDSNYDEVREQLTIPDRYGAVEVIDGQHRLFSYAHARVEQKRGVEATILVTAIAFRGTSAAVRQKYSARTFVEINTNQTKITTSHLDAIAYEVLGHTTPKAIAAAVLIKLNTSSGVGRGIFKSQQTALAPIASPTVAIALRRLVDLEGIEALAVSRVPEDRLRATGYSQLFGAAPGSLTKAPVLITSATSTLNRYFLALRTHFGHDWPKRGEPRRLPSSTSSFAYAKFFAALIMLFDDFVSEGLTWGQVNDELTNIRSNVLRLRRLGGYTSVLFDHAVDAKIPSSVYSASDDHRFLQANRSTPTSI